MNDAPTWIYSIGDDGKHVLSRQSGETTITAIYERTAKPKCMEIIEGDEVELVIKRYEIGEISPAEEHGTFHVYVGVHRPSWEGGEITPDENYHLLRRVETNDEESEYPIQRLTETILRVGDARAEELSPGDFCSVTIRKII